jgi:hypothetical protein
MVYAWAPQLNGVLYCLGGSGGCSFRYCCHPDREGFGAVVRREDVFSWDRVAFVVGQYVRLPRPWAEKEVGGRSGGSAGAAQACGRDRVPESAVALREVAVA